MYCHNCGTETTDHQTYCTDCGAELVYQSPSAGSEQETTVGPSGSAEPGSSDHEDTEQRTGHQDNAKSSQKRSPEREQTASETARSASTTASQGPDGSDQARELASNALFGYSFIVLFRLTGISGILFQPHPENPFFATALHDIGVFVFYDGFLLAITAFIASAYLTARHHLDLGLPPNTRGQVDTAATICLSGSSLLYILGIIVSVAG